MNDGTTYALWAIGVFGLVILKYWTPSRIVLLSLKKVLLDDFLWQYPLGRILLFGRTTVNATLTVLRNSICG